MEPNGFFFFCICKDEIEHKSACTVTSIVGVVLSLNFKFETQVESRLYVEDLFTIIKKARFGCRRRVLQI